AFEAVPIAVGSNQCDRTLFAVRIRPRHRVAGFVVDRRRAVAHGEQRRREKCGESQQYNCSHAKDPRFHIRERHGTCARYSEKTLRRLLLLKERPCPAFRKKTAPPYMHIPVSDIVQSCTICTSSVPRLHQVADSRHPTPRLSTFRSGNNAPI